MASTIEFINEPDTIRNEAVDNGLLVTDNQIELLRKLLAERGIEYEESQDRFCTRFRFNYCEACGDYLNSIELMGSCITASKHYLTLEQAIAVTLRGGELTAEWVRKVIEEAEEELLESCEYIGDIGQRKTDVLKAFDKIEQAIADELNATLSGRECK